MNLIDVRYNVCICIFILEKEGAEVWLTALHHVFDGCDDGGIAYDNCFVKAWKEGPSGNWKSKDLWVNFWDRISGYGT